MSRESVSYDQMSDAFNAALERYDLRAWRAIVRANKEMAMHPLWALDTFAFEPIFQISRNNRERNARLDAHDRELAAIRTRLGIESVGGPPTSTPTTSKPRVHFGPYVLGRAYQRGDVVMWSGQRYLSLVDDNLMPPDCDVGEYNWRRI